MTPRKAWQLPGPKRGLGFVLETLAHVDAAIVDLSVMRDVANVILDVRDGVWVDDVSSDTMTRLARALPASLETLVVAGDTRAIRQAIAAVAESATLPAMREVRLDTDRRLETMEWKLVVRRSLAAAAPNLERFF